MSAEALSVEAVVAPMSNDTVHVGRDGWLFLVGGSNSVEDFYKKNSAFTDELAQAWVELLRARNERMTERGIDYFHIAAPEKLSVFNKYYDGELEDPDGGPICQLRNNYLGAVPSLVNLVDYFRQGAESGTNLYWKTDTHWSCYGAYAAYQMLLSRLGDPLRDDLLGYPGTEGEAVLDLGGKLNPPIFEKARWLNLERHSVRRYANELVRFKERNNLIDEPHLHSGSHVIFENRTAAAIDKVVVLFGDSFSEYRPQLLTGMLAETYREVHFIWNSNIDDEYVKQVKPDIVLTELAERFMVQLPTDDLDISSFAKERIEAYKSEHPDFVEKPALELKVNPNLQRTIFTPETYQLDPPVTVQPACVNNCNDKAMETHSVWVTEAENPKVYLTGDRCLVTATNGDVIQRYNVDDDRAARIEYEHHRKLPGTSLLLGDSAGSHCYYHWMLDLMPKLGMMERMGIPISSIDHVLIREIYHDFQVDSLARFGIKKSQIVQTKKRSYWQPEKLVHVHINNAISLKMNKFIPAWLNHSFPSTGKKIGGKKLYVSRPKGVRRGVANEDELRPILEAAGFEFAVMEGLTVREQAELMSDVSVLMSPHGGALTNMVFCPPGAKVVELFGRHVYPFYYGLASLCGHRYYTILEDPVDYPRLVNHAEAQAFGSAEIQKATMALAFDVSPTLLERMLQKLED